MKAEVLTIGDELLRGEITDSNKSFLSQRLLTLDIETRFHVTCADDRNDIADVFRRAAERSEVVLVSGGLGPTRDDITIEVLAETFGRKLVLHQPSLDALRGFFARFGREMAAINEKQAWFPEGAEVLDNPIGTAPGTMLEVPREGGGSALFFCMPGVPRELYRMMEEQVLPRVAGRLGGGRGVMRAALLRTFGVGESNLEDMLKDVGREPGVVLGFRTSFPDNFLRPVARAATLEEAEAKLARACAAIAEKLGPLVYTRGEETMEAVVGHMLAERGLTIATAESCTGGLIGARITAVPGSSRYYRGGVVAYANEAKRSATCSACPRRCSASTAQSLGRWRVRWRRAPAHGSAQISRSRRRASRAQTAGPPRSPSASSGSRSPRRTASRPNRWCSRSTASVTVRSPRRRHSTGFDARCSAFRASCRVTCGGSRDVGKQPRVAAPRWQGAAGAGVSRHTPSRPRRSQRGCRAPRPLRAQARLRGAGLLCGRARR